MTLVRFATKFYTKGYHIDYNLRLKIIKMLIKELSGWHIAGTNPTF
jgi:hypothetical protein